MEALVNYIKPELLITAVALYFMGIALKEAQAVKDKYIPLILGGVGILVCGIYVFATCSYNTAQDIAMAVFTSRKSERICYPGDCNGGCQMPFYWADAKF